MATVSRSAAEFMRRMGVIPTPQRTNPRLDLGGLKIAQIPLDQDQLHPDVLLDAAGSPPPDRGQTDTWPPQQEVS